MIFFKLFRVGLRGQVCTYEFVELGLGVGNKLLDLTDLVDKAAGLCQAIKRFLERLDGGLIGLESDQLGEIGGGRIEVGVEPLLLNVDLESRVVAKFRSVLGDDLAVLAVVRFEGGPALKALHLECTQSGLLVLDAEQGRAFLVIAIGG